MGLFDRMKEVLSGEHLCPPEDLAAYRRLGEEVYGVEVELADCQVPRARALLRAAKGFQVMADALLQDAFSSEGHEIASVPMITHALAETWYGRIPDLLIGAKQEAMFAGAAKTVFPARLGARTESRGPCPIQHLAGMRRAADAIEVLLVEGLERAGLDPAAYKEALLLYVGVNTNRQTADAIVGSIANGQHVPAKTHEEAEKAYWAALSDGLAVAQALDDPLAQRPTEPIRGARAIRLDTADVWKVTSNTAKADIRRSGEWEEAERDLTELWNGHRITDEEREYEQSVNRLTAQGVIRENGYWYCCPFQSVYKVIDSTVSILGQSIPSGHVFVWNYGEDGAPGRLVTRASFRAADSRHYCEE